MTAGNAIAKHIAERTPFSVDSIGADAKGYRKELPLPTVPQKLECVFFETYITGIVFGRLEVNGPLPGLEATS